MRTLSTLRLAAKERTTESGITTTVYRWECELCGLASEASTNEDNVIKWALHHAATHSVEGYIPEEPTDGGTQPEHFAAWDVGLN